METLIATGLKHPSFMPSGYKPGGILIEIGQHYLPEINSGILFASSDLGERALHGTSKHPVHFMAGDLMLGIQVPIVFDVPVFVPPGSYLSGDINSRIVDVLQKEPAYEMNAGILRDGIFVGGQISDMHSGPILQPPSVVLNSLAGDYVITYYLSNWSGSPITVGQVSILGDSAIDLVSQELPLVIQPEHVYVFQCVVRLNGSAVVSAVVEVTLTDPDRILTSSISGVRVAPIFDIPEVPIEETWTYMTNNIMAADGSEQRIAVRGKMPRIQQSVKYLISGIGNINRFKSSIFTTGGKSWMPEFQYTTPITGSTEAGGNRIYFDNSLTDIREGERAIIHNGSKYEFVTIKLIQEDGAELLSNTTMSFDSSFFIVPGSAAILDDGFKLSRGSTNEVGEFSLSGKFQRVRSQSLNPIASVTFPTYSNRLVLEKLPLADDEIDDTISTGNESIDNGTGIFDSVSLWKYSRASTNCQFKINRLNSHEDMNFWKAFADETAGASKKFWMPTFRPDLVPVSATELNVLTVDGVEYAEQMFGVETYKYLRLVTSAGIKYVKVTSAESIGGGRSKITVTPGWLLHTQVYSACFMRPVRLADDTIKFTHGHTDSKISFSVIDAEP